MKIRFAILFKLLLLSACGPGGGSSELAAEGNGAGYPGGDGHLEIFSGSYYNVLAAPECYDIGLRDKNVCYKWELDLSEPGVRLKSSTKASYNNGVKRSHLFMATYNPDFIGHSGHIFARPGALPVDANKNPVLVPEAWCIGKGERVHEGLDLVILSAPEGGNRHGRTYAGVYEDSGAHSFRSTGDEPATRTVKGSLVTYEIAGLTATIDLASPTSRSPYRYNGTMLIESTGAEIPVTCSIGGNGRR
ncbi:MAG TPA: hypothetical protein VFV50_16355 [Bdellovibrionales bacterium]|nr:hypothetical protein [Bdellovibrionales bacterium]